METQDPKAVVAAILDELKKELLDAKADLEAAQARYGVEFAAANDEGRPLILATREAEAAMRVLVRLKGRLPQQAYDEKHRGLSSAHKDALAAEKAFRASAEARIAPSTVRVRDAIALVERLEGELAAHGRIANAFGV